MITLTNQQQIEDFVRGCCFYATGGGGDPLFGQKMLREALDAGKQIRIVDANELAEDIWTVCPYLMGPAPGAESNEIKQAKKTYGLTEEVISNMPTAAVQLLLEQDPINLGAVVPFELGAAATASAVATAAWLDVPTIDGDYAGRALPEIAQILPAILDFNLLPIASCDRFGNQIIIKKTTSQKMTERFGKILATGSFGLVGQATLLRKLKQMKPAILFHTLSKALTVGKALREARKNNAIQSITELTQAKILFTGRVIEHQAENQEGYYVGQVKFEGTDNFKNNYFKIWVKNENILSWLNDEPYIACPDLITMIDKSTFEPIIMGKLAKDTEVIIFGIKAFPQFQTQAALKVLGPQHFGFEFNAKPL